LKAGRFAARADPRSNASVANIDGDCQQTARHDSDNASGDKAQERTARSHGNPSCKRADRDDTYRKEAIDKADSISQQAIHCCLRIQVVWMVQTVPPPISVQSAYRTLA
jgi:hypothetical protein